MAAWCRRWAVPVAAALVLIFSLGFLAGRASVPYAIAAATERPAQAQQTDDAAQTPEETAPQPAQTPVDGAAEKIDLNTADSEQLQTLPGIGAVLAERIIEYRAVSGGFQTPEQLMEVSGIGEQKYEALREYITVAPMEDKDENTGG